MRAMTDAKRAVHAVHAVNTVNAVDAVQCSGRGMRARIRNDILYSLSFLQKSFLTQLILRGPREREIARDAVTNGENGLTLLG